MGNRNTTAVGDRISWLREEAANVRQLLKRNPELGIGTAIAVVMFALFTLPFVLVWCSRSASALQRTAVHASAGEAPAVGTSETKDTDGEVKSDESRDPTVEAIRRIVTGRYEFNVKVATGRFLKKFREHARRIH